MCTSFTIDGEGDKVMVGDLVLLMGLMSAIQIRIPICTFFLIEALRVISQRGYQSIGTIWGTPWVTTTPLPWEHHVWDDNRTVMEKMGGGGGGRREGGEGSHGTFSALDDRGTGKGSPPFFIAKHLCWYAPPF